MLKASYIGNQKIHVDELNVIELQSDEVQIEVAYVGLCGTDLHIIHGNMDKRVVMPLIFGHEMSGTVVAIGPGVSGWKIGDLATVMPLKWDDTCHACLEGHQHICQNLNFVGIDSSGALQALWNVPQSILVPLPKEISLLHAALVEPVAVAVHDVERAEISPGQKIIVLGGGPIGILIAVIAREKGAKVIISELDQPRRELIESLGFTTVNPKLTELVEFVDQWTEGKGVDVVFEVSGASSAVLQSTDLVKVRGLVVIVAIHGTPKEMNLQRVFWRELTIVGVRVYQHKDFEVAIKLIAQNKIPCDTLISEVIPISKISEAVKKLEGGLAMKILIDVQESGKL
jgi:2-desacetyl-2-hydroxyethyl bacteriochlorophyllide A dehydrogenase